jgi:two-component system, OmpR family, response regulator
MGPELKRFLYDGPTLCEDVSPTAKVSGVQARKQRVLIVEDDPALQKLVLSYLNKLGNVEVTVASNGVAAIERLDRGEQPDLVCLDLMLPQVSGFDVCEHMRRSEALKSVPVLIMSARTLPEDRAQAEEVGATAYLIKPFSRAQFTQQVVALLKQSPRK